MNTKTIPKNQKPIEYDIHLKYICAKCGQPHWLSFKEASTKHFKVVCDCGCVFGVKRISGFALKYHKKKPTPTKTPQPTETIKPPEAVVPSISTDLLNKTVRALIPYGFTEGEAKVLITNSYKQYPNDDILLLVKQVLESLRSSNVKS